MRPWPDEKTLLLVLGRRKKQGLDYLGLSYTIESVRVSKTQEGRSALGRRSVFRSARIRRV